MTGHRTPKELTQNNPDQNDGEPIPSAERQSFLRLTRELASLPLDKSAAAIETSAAIAAISLRAGIEFLRAAAAAAEILSPSELRSWGEMGRRLALGDIETAITFFAAGVDDLKLVSTEVHPLLFQLCARQITLSAPVALETLKSFPAQAVAINEPLLLAPLLEVASEIARRSARHSAEFLKATPDVIRRLRSLGGAPVVSKAVEVAAEFASRAGGIAADAWSALPDALRGLRLDDSLKLLDSTIRFLERGGGSALQVLITGGEILRSLPEVFDDWIKLLWTVAQHGNASLVAFVRSSPRSVLSLSRTTNRDQLIDVASRVIRLTTEIAETDGEAALACFRSSALALRSASIDQFEQWARLGLAAHTKDARGRRSYFALETRGSHDALRSGSSGLPLEDVRHLLILYIEGLTGHEVDITPLAAVPLEARIADGRTIHLPSTVAEFGDGELDFRLYKVLAAHAAGQIEFGTYERGTEMLQAAYATLAETYDPANADARAAFSQPDEVVGQTVGQRFLSVPGSKEERRDRNVCPTEVDYLGALRLFPNLQLARRIFGTLENCRIDRRLRAKYRGLARDLDLIREHLRRGRPSVLELPASLLPFELLFQTMLLGGAADDARQYYSQLVSELETVASEYLSKPSVTVADSLLATSRVYSMFQSLSPNDDSIQEIETQEEPSESDEENAIASESFSRRPKEKRPERRDARELFNAWNDPDGDGEPDELAGAEAWVEAELPEQVIEEGEVAYNYDEWDRELTDHRLGWCRVIEKRVKQGDKAFVEQTRDRYRGVISSIRYQFQLMKPEELTRVTNEVDGEEFDLDAVVDYVIDRRAAKVGGGHQSERLYTRRLRRRRDVAVSFLLDQSSSTARTIGRHPLQPYTRPGRRIIEIEKEGLVLMSEALEAVGDAYSINGFTSEGRRNVKFYVVKDFNEAYSDEVKQRIGGISFQNNTRLGAAIRHATAKLAKQEARTRLLIVLSDGRPYDHDYGDARYAREDTREALRQAKVQGITPFCITIDRESEAELRDLYGEVGYTIIDDVLSLPERMPAIYRRLTT